MSKELKSLITDADWERLKGSNLVDIATGHSSTNFVFEDSEGNHFGFRLIESSKRVELESIKYSRQNEVE